jgi:hypothetical protein
MVSAAIRATPAGCNRALILSGRFVIKWALAGFSQ